MPHEANERNTTRARRFIARAILVIAAAGAILLATSVVFDLWISKSAAARVASRLGDAPSQSELLACHDDVVGLLDRLAVGAADALRAEPKPGAASVSRRWSYFARSWQEDWRVTGARCRFDELEGAHLGVHYDRVANVYDGLQEMFLRYSALVRQFEQEQVDSLIAMRRALTKSKHALQRRRP